MIFLRTSERNGKHLLVIHPEPYNRLTHWLVGRPSGEMTCLKKGAEVQGLALQPGQEVLRCPNCNWVHYWTIIQCKAKWSLQRSDGWGAVVKTSLGELHLWLILSFKWEGNKKTKQNLRLRIKCKIKTGEEERSWLHLNNQIWIRRRFVTAVFLFINTFATYKVN